jgi:predicted SnoaL-like aldol condensation-catalyzing enzyme
MTVKKNTPSRAQSSTSACTKTHTAKSSQLKGKDSGKGTAEGSKNRGRAEELLATRKYHGQKIEAKLRDALDKPDELRRLLGAIDAAERKASEMFGKAFDEGAVNYAFKAYSAALEHYHKHEGERAALSRLVINYAELQEADPRVDLDLVAVAEQYELAARALIDFYDHTRGVPDWLTDLIMRGLEAATEKTGIEHWEGEGFDLRGLANLFAVTSPTNFKLGFEQKRDLPELISAVLRHPDTPVNLYNAIGDAVTEWQMDDSDPTYLRLALANLTTVQKEITEDEVGAE